MKTLNKWGLCTSVILLCCLHAPFALSGNILTSEKKIYSQHNEELIIRDFFNDKRDGFFLDVGCADPISLSTTCYLEKKLGWKGIGIDAIPLYASKYKKERPRTEFYNYIVTDHSNTKETFYVSRSSWDVSSTDQDYVKKYGPFSVPIQVNTITLNDLLSRRGVRQIDFLSMDIEDGEPLALQGFDIQRYKPRLVCIEAHDHVAAQITDYFRKNNYERIEAYDAYDKVNWYFTPKKDRVSRDRSGPGGKV